MPNAKTEEWFTVAEAAAVLKLTDETVRRMLRRGTIRGARVTRQWRVSRTELERIAKGERTDGTE
jgi:excisionase family DNA binding protein